ncbi:unnamed protein product [Lota lota]
MWLSYLLCIGLLPWFCQRALRQRARGVDPHQPHPQPGESDAGDPTAPCSSAKAPCPVGGDCARELRQAFVLTDPHTGYDRQCMYLLLHTVKGTTFETPDQGKARLLTHGSRWTTASSSPPHASSSTINSPYTLHPHSSTPSTTALHLWSTPVLLIVLIPKLPPRHGVRIFGINKY